MQYNPNINGQNLDPTRVFTDPVTGHPLPILVTLAGSGASSGPAVATADLQTAGNATLSSILTTLSSMSAADALEATSALQTSILNALATTNASLVATNTALATTNTDLAPLATSTLQTTGNSTLSSILTAINGLSTAEATAALQMTGNSTLSSILTALGDSGAIKLELMMLQTILTAIQNEIGIGGGSSLQSLLTTISTNTTQLNTVQPVSLPSGQQTASLSRATNPGSIFAGTMTNVTITNTGTTDGTVQGATLHAGEWVAFESSPGKTLGPISYVPGTEFVIATVGV